MKTALPALVAALLLSTAASAADPLPWELSGCAQAAGSSVTLQLCGKCPGFTNSEATFTAPVQGTVNMRLDWTVDGDNLYASLIVDGSEDAPFVLMTTALGGWCAGPWPCSGAEPSIAMHLLPGQTLSLRLANDTDGSCSGGSTTCIFSEIRFTPDVGFVTGPGALDRRLLADVPGTVQLDQLGSAVAQPGDLDGDGCADLVATASPVFGSSRSVHAFSGASGALLFKVLLPPVENVSGLPIAAPGDVNGDGIGDILVGHEGHTGPVRVLSGDGGSALLVLTPPGQNNDWHGHAVAAAGDVNLDGVPDLLIGSPLWNADAVDNGVVRVHSGAGGGVLLQAYGLPHDRLGEGLASPGDVNGDGVPDIAAGARQANTFGSQKGAVVLLSGSTGDPLASLAGPDDESGFGRFVAAAGDLDGDGVGDIAAGSPFVFFNLKGQVRAWSGASHQLLFAHDGETLSHLGVSMAPAGDWDGDGLGDLFAGAAYIGDGEVHVLAGRDGALLHVLTPGVPALAALPPVDQFGFSMAVGGDVDGDGIGDLLVGAFGSAAAGGLDSAGRVFAISGNPSAHLAPTLAGVGDLVAGSALVLRLAGAPADATAFLVASAAKLNAAFHGGLLVPQPDFVAPLATGPDGSTSLSTHWPAGVPAGASVWMQAWCPQPLALHGWVASDALQIIQP